MSHASSGHSMSAISEGLHLVALTAFALLQPILDRLSANPQYLKLEGYAGSVVLAVLAVLLTAIPLSVILTLFVLRRLKAQRAARMALGIAVTMLSVMSLLVVGRWFSRSNELLTIGVPDFGLAVVACCGGIAVAWLYFRSDVLRQVLSVSAFGAIVFPLSFLSSPSIREQVLGIAAREYQSEMTATNPAPVVVIVFDGLCGMSLLDEHHEIDRLRYPSFGRLADISSFYRNATTVHTRTDHAVPAMLSSCLPVESQRPVEADYPLNLFRLIHNTRQYDMTVFEPATQMAPDDLRQVSHQRTWCQQFTTLLDVLLRVYARVSVPGDAESISVDLPKTWFGIVPFVPGERRHEKGRVVYGWDTLRDVQLRHFTDSLESAAKPGFRFLHVVVPHDPWNLLPSGKWYQRITSVSDKILGESQEEWVTDEWLVHQAWQRYLLQLQFADLWLGRILDRLDANGQLEPSLVVVASDHGMAFVPGVSRRTPTDRTVPDIVSVPLFIKQPGQTAGRISDDNVETIDVLPTIADALGLPSDSAWEGQSLLREDLPERPRKTVRGHIDTILDARFDQRFEYVDRMIRVFGTGGADDRLWKLHSIPELVGRRVETFAVGEPADGRARLFFGGEDLDPEQPEFVPCYLHGKQIDLPVTAGMRHLAVALNGVILATTKTSVDHSCQNEWAAILPDSEYRPDGNRLQIFDVEVQGSTFILHEVALEPFSG